MSEILPESPTILESEIELIFNTIFGAIAQPNARTAYRKFHIIYRQSLLVRKNVNMVKLLSSGLDIEAVEFFLRTRYPGNLLTCKLWACAYLYEAQEGKSPSGRTLIQPDRVTGGVVCLLILGWFGFHSAAKWLKGAFQTYWHGLL
jgi:hypothetical protein